MDCPLAYEPNACFAKHRQRLLSIRYPGETIECSSCHFARLNAEAVHVPAPDIEPHPLRGNGCHKPGTKPEGACGRGHSRAEYGRRMTVGRDQGGYACRECERIRREKYREART
jgi:hypothetical protein